MLNIATDNIPQTSPFNKKRPKPWFDEECKAAKRERNKANRLLRRYPCLNNAIKAKVANARAKRTFKQKKTSIMARLCFKNKFQDANKQSLEHGP